MTIHECATVLLAHFSPEERSIPDDPTYPGRNSAILEAMNGALQECYGSGSPWLRWDERGAILKTPTTVSIAVENGSRDAVITGWEDWMAGCSIVIAGHDVDNMIRNDDAAAVLKYPYDGTTGTVSAIVYHDCLTMDEDVMAVYGPLRVSGREILPRPNTGLSSIQTEDYGAHNDFGIIRSTFSPRVGPSSGHPVGYVIETWTPSELLGPVVRVRIVPAAGISGVVDYRAMLRPPVIADINGMDPPPVPFGFVQTIFLPIARQKLTASPFWRDQSGGEEIRRAYQEAIDMLSKLHPSKDTGITLQSRF